jgi:Carboxypeptidase regulatory-like domain/TonB-dependent Receptor Plug Domain
MLRVADNQVGEFMDRICNYLSFTAVAIVAGVGLHAQSTITLGSISGKVTDSNGAPVAGAQVILTSNQMTRNTVTTADGTYRAGLMNPGTWEVKVAKTEFQTQMGSVTVSPNENRSVNFKLSPIASMTVVVSASSTVLDTTSVSLGQSTTMDQIASIPQSRDFSGVALFAPGVVNNGGFNASSPSMSGASGAENSYFVDGLDTTDIRYGFQGAQLKTDFIDQVSVQTGGFAPEYSAWRRLQCHHQVRFERNQGFRLDNLGCCWHSRGAQVECLFSRAQPKCG